MDGSTHFVGRLCDGLRRRAIGVWSRWMRGARRPPVEAALEWLLARDAGTGLPAAAGSAAGCPATTALALRMALAFGLRDLVERWAYWLVAAQQADGSFADPASPARRLEATARAARSLMLVAPDLPEAARAAAAACAWLAGRVAAQGVLGPATEEGTRMVCLPPLLHGARRWDRPAWERVVIGALSGPCRAEELTAGNAPLETLAGNIDALMELDLHAAAIDALRRLAAAQRRDGSLPERPGAATASCAGLAHVAALWYRAGQPAAADRAMRWLFGRQRRDGSFPPGRAAAVIHFLSAARLQVQAAFEAQAEGFPAEIAAADGRMEAVRGWFAGLAPDARVADVGCGKGRFLRHLMIAFPRARLLGIDAAAAMLASLPAGVAACRASLLAIPLPDGTLDAAFAVESLEHALLPERAVAELCRLVRPGGRVLVIDKHRAKQWLSHHDPWERWFTPEELAAWLARHCDEVTVGPVPHLEGRPGSDLFLAAAGRRRAAP